MAKREIFVDVNTIANMSARVKVEVDGEGKTKEAILNEAEEIAINQAKSGDVVWQYDGVLEYIVSGVS